MRSRLECTLCAVFLLSLVPLVAARYLPFDAQVHVLETPTDSGIEVIAYGDGTWLALGSDDYLLRSTNAVDWTVVHGLGEIPAFSGWSSNRPFLAYGNGVWVAHSRSEKAGAWSNDNGDTGAGRGRSRKGSFRNSCNSTGLMGEARKAEGLPVRE